jgi:hypothetical protein
VSAELLQKAREMLAAGDLLQASEKGWGAAAQAVKALAERRGWPHNGHRQLFATVDSVAREADDAQIRRLFDAANGLHQNFYEHWLSAEGVEERLNDVEAFVQRLNEL